jgi:hypothetical protein
MATEKVLQEGLKSFYNFLHRRFMSPLKWILGGMIFFHSTIMAMGIFHGELVTGSQSLKALPDSTYIYGSIVSFIIYLAITLYIVYKLIGIGFIKYFKSDRDQEDVSLGWRICWVILMVVLMPIYLTIIISLIIIFVFYLYCIVWYYALTKSSGNGDGNFVRLLPDRVATRWLSNGVLVIYTIILAFFFNELISYSLPAPGMQTSFIGAFFQTSFAMVCFYLPFRLFFGLYSGHSRLGWVTFSLSIVIVFFQTIQRFGI